MLSVVVMAFTENSSDVVAHSYIPIHQMDNAMESKPAEGSGHEGILLRV